MGFKSKLTGFINSAFGQSDEKTRTPKTYCVRIPEEEYVIAEISNGEKVGTAIINKGLENFSPKEVFGWECTIRIVLKDLDSNSLPTPEESKAMYLLEDKLCEILKGKEANVNALHVGHLIIDGTLECLWRVHNPEKAYNDIKDFADNGNPIRHFKYEIVKDSEWKLTRPMYERSGLKL